MISRDDLERVADRLMGSCANVEDVLDELEIEADPDEVEAALSGVYVERCPGCAWWMESGELLNDDGDAVGCDQCRERQRCATCGEPVDDERSGE